MPTVIADPPMTLSAAHTVASIVDAVPQISVAHNWAYHNETAVYAAQAAWLSRPTPYPSAVECSDYAPAETPYGNTGSGRLCSQNSS